MLTDDVDYVDLGGDYFAQLNPDLAMRRDSPIIFGPVFELTADLVDRFPEIVGPPSQRARIHRARSRSGLSVGWRQLAFFLPSRCARRW